MTPQTILIVKDKKPTSAVRDGVAINFTITKAGYDQLVLSHPNRYEIVGPYLNKNQIKKNNNPPADALPAVPAIEEIKDGLTVTSTPDNIVPAEEFTEEKKDAEKLPDDEPKAVELISTDYDAKEAIEKIRQSKTVAELNAFYDENETRKTVTAAYEEQYNLLPE